MASRDGSGPRERVDLDEAVRAARATALHSRRLRAVARSRRLQTRALLACIRTSTARFEVGRVLRVGMLLPPVRTSPERVWTTAEPAVPSAALVLVASVPGARAPAGPDTAPVARRTDHPGSPDEPLAVRPDATASEDPT